MKSILIFLFITQTNTPELSLADWTFRQIQIEWVAENTKVRYLEQVIPEKHAALVRALGCEHYGCRELAKGQLREMGDEAFDALVWGTRVKDAEIKRSANTLLNRLFKCKECDGRGHEDPEKDYMRCIQCRGSGDLRFKISYIDSEDGNILVPINLFPSVLVNQE